MKQHRKKLEHEEFYEGGSPDSYKYSHLCEEALLPMARHDTMYTTLKIVVLSAWYRFPTRLIIVTVLSGLASLFRISEPKYLQQIIDLLLLGDGTSSPLFWWYLFLFTFTALGYIVSLHFFRSHVFYIATQVEDAWKYCGMKKLYSLPYKYYNSVDSSRVASDLLLGAGSVWALINVVLGNELLMSAANVLFVLYAALSSHPEFWWIWLPPLPLFFIFNSLFGNTLITKQKGINELAKQSDVIYHDGIANLRAVKAFGKEDREVKCYALKWSTYHEKEYERDWIAFYKTGLQNGVEVTMRVMLILYCFMGIKNGTITVGTMTLLISYQAMLLDPLLKLTRSMTDIRRRCFNCKGLFDLLKEKDTMQDKPGAIDARPLQRAIKVKHLSFRYEAMDSSDKLPHKVSIPKGPRNALNDVTFKIKRGTTTGLVGRSGAGKSTLVNLLMRFYDPSEGFICWDSTNLKDLTSASLRTHIAVVPQEASLFNRTIAENIAYGNPDASMEEIIQAAKKASAHEFILTTPQGYESIIGERGIKLSGGQRQRIAIARALLVQPSLLVFDESTSNLDSESEKVIQESIQFLHHKVTQVIIAHRLSTVLNADQIIVLDEGKIDAIGTHEVLLKTSQIYHKLYTLQFHDKKNERNTTVSRAG